MFGPRYLFFFLPPVVSFLLLLASGCSRERREKAIGEGYILSEGVTLRDRWGSSSGSVATLKAGERVEVLQRRRRWARLRTTAGLEGWLEERLIIVPEIYERAQQLVREAVVKPSQGHARARSLANLHLDPERKSPRFFQLQVGEACEVLEHRAVDRPLPPGAPAPASAATPPPPGTAPTPPSAKAKKGKGLKRTGPPMEDWFLVRGQRKAGWALVRFFDMAIPDEVAQYSEGRAITAWQVLDEVTDGAEKKPQYLWASSSSVGSPYDFDGIRVFTWNSARHRYETAYREHSLRGVYPLVVGRETVKDAEVPSFAVNVLDAAGNRSTRHFVLLGNTVRRREQVR